MVLTGRFPSRVLVCGSRGWTDDDHVRARIAGLPEWVTIVHGRAPEGADAIAQQVAEDLGLDVEEHPADFRRRGRGAGIIRNREMLDSGIDLVVAFWDGESPGTRDAIEEARRRRIPVEVHLLPSAGVG